MMEEADEVKHFLCDICNESMPLVYCRADSARLCFECDRSVHSDNLLFSKHQRFHLCNACESNPASIYCSTHNLFLCQNCDWEAHNLPSVAHDRRHLDGFSGCPSVLEFASALGIGDKDLLEGDDISDWVSEALVDDGGLERWAWEMTEPITSFDALIVPTTSRHQYQALGFPAPKHRNVSCGKYKEEILQQLRKLAKKENHLKDDCSNLDMIQENQFLGQEQSTQRQNVSLEFENDEIRITSPGCEANAVQWHGKCNGAKEVHFSYREFLEGTIEEGSSSVESYTGLNASGNCGNDQVEKVLPNFEEIPKFRPKVYELTGHDRDVVISRYKEKKKTRRYDKHIRYASRKARADSRTRINGRFAKMSQNQKGD